MSVSRIDRFFCIRYNIIQPLFRWAVVFFLLTGKVWGSMAQPMYKNSPALFNKGEWPLRPRGMIPFYFAFSLPSVTALNKIYSFGNINIVLRTRSRSTKQASFLSSRLLAAFPSSQQPCKRVGASLLVHATSAAGSRRKQTAL